MRTSEFDRDEFVMGAHNAQCDRCGWKYKNFQLRKEWNGLRTCHGGGTNNCWEERHPQDFVRGVRDSQKPAWVRPESDDNFLSTNEVTRDDL